MTIIHRLHKPVWFVLSYLPILLVALTFATHAVMGLSGSADLRDIVSVLGFGSTITALLVFFTGLHDGTVTAFVLAKDKLAPDLAWSLVFIYAAIWPIVPRVLIWQSGKPFEWIEIVIFGALALIAWAAHTLRSKYHLRWS